MTVLLQTFAFTVTLKKLVHRTDAQASAAAPVKAQAKPSSPLQVDIDITVPSKSATAAKPDQIDLTRYMTENDSVKTVKSMNQPGGGFTITFADQLASEVQDTIYALIEPMDLIEFRASRHPENFAGQDLPLIMRAYVSSIQRDESIGDDGTPQRQIVVRGIDSGKIWQMNQVLFMYEQAVAKSFLLPLQLLAENGLDGGTLPVGDYMQKLVDYMNTKVEQLAAYGNQLIPKFVLKSTVMQGRAWIQSVGTKQGPIWTYAEAFADRPWNELFLLDEEDGPVLYFRPAAFKDLEGNYVIDGAVDPGSFDIAAVEILSMSVFRSDARVANFYWVEPDNGLLGSNGGVTATTIVNALPLDANYPNDSATLYGERIMQATTQLQPNELTISPAMLPAALRAEANGQWVSWYTLRSEQLKAMNRDNSVLEEGSATVNGREDIIMGQYVRFTRGTVVSEAYVTQVAHVFSPLRSWVSQLSLARGTGFYSRSRATDVPFFAEGQDGPYSR